MDSCDYDLQYSLKCSATFSFFASSSVFFINTSLGKKDGLSSEDLLSNSCVS